MARSSARPFLTARWEDLVLVNWECPRKLLDPLVPTGTELDLWDGKPRMSLVGFMFRDTRVMGIPFPGHRTFEEVNLRFYVRRTTPEGELRRAVVFVRELVPRRIIATVARVAYNEPYLAVPMSHEGDLDAARGGTVGYSWTDRGGEFSMSATSTGPAGESSAGSEAEFITEHYWGYTRQRDGGTLEYRVDHPRWRVWTSPAASCEGRFRSLYGDSFGSVMEGAPRSSFVAPGSEVAVYRGRRLG